MDPWEKPVNYSPWMETPFSKIVLIEIQPEKDKENHSIVDNIRWWNGNNNSCQLVSFLKSSFLAILSIH